MLQEATGFPNEISQLKYQLTLHCYSLGLFEVCQSHSLFVCNIGIITIIIYVSVQNNTIFVNATVLFLFVLKPFLGLLSSGGGKVEGGKVGVGGLCTLPEI